MTQALDSVSFILDYVRIHFLYGFVLFRLLIFFVAIFFVCFGGAEAGFSAEPSASQWGVLGLNTIPSARMDEVGSVRTGVSTLDPYVNGFFGVQLTKPLYVQLRQSAEVSGLSDDADHLYPGVDFKLRLFDETRARPAVVVGAQSAVGHKRTAGEYLALSKRYKSFDFTGGLGWGRFGSAGHFDNPLSVISEDHFGGERSLDGEMPNEPSDWFTGEKVGLFGGIEYFTPVKGLSIKADYGADRYSAESRAFDYDAPSPWSVGLNYSPLPWADVSVGTQGGDKVMARLSLTSAVGAWKDYMDDAPDVPVMRGRPYATSLIDTIEEDADQHGMSVYDVAFDTRSIEASIAIEPGLSATNRVGRAAVILANHAAEGVETIRITPNVDRLRGPDVVFMRRSLERLHIDGQGSAAEVWQHASFDDANGSYFERPNPPKSFWPKLKSFSFRLENQISLAEEDSGSLRRSSFIARYRGKSLLGSLGSSLGLRVNVHDNLGRLKDIRPRSVLPVRSNVDEFADRRIALDTAYDSFMHSFTPSFHGMVRGGYLEEMYFGYGGEVLYRPFNKRFALGVEAWQAFKRDPNQSLNMGLSGDHILIGHVNGWYDVPEHDVTLKASAGRYLAEDIGGSVSLSKTFDNGASLEAFVTVTDQADFDQFGGTTHSYNGLRFSLPLGGFKYAPRNSGIDVAFEPFGRDTGQRLQVDDSLYDLTEPLSQKHMVQHWDDIR